MITWLLIAACGLGEGSSARREEAVLGAMGDHWTEATLARDALIDGDLRRATRAASRVGADLPADVVRADLLPMRLAVIEAADRAAKADDLAAAAVAVGEMAWHCGACHAVSGLPVPVEEPPSVIGGALTLEMGRHQQAVHEMWRGLVTHDDAAVIAATRILETEPLIPSGTPADSPLPPVATELEIGVHELAGQIARAEGAERGQRFGQLLTTCATCHKLFRK